jgi:hypothetical protein
MKKTQPPATEKKEVKNREAYTPGTQGQAETFWTSAAVGSSKRKQRNPKAKEIATS